MRVHVQLSQSAVGAAERAVELEQVGVDGVFSFESGHDVFLPLAVAAPTCGLPMMTNVAIAFPRSPMVLASTANDLQLLTRGQFRLGLGSQVKPHIEKRFGARWGKPVAQMGEWVSAIKAIFSAWNDGTPLDFRGEYTTHTLMTPAFSAEPNPFGPPKVLVAALGPRMHEMSAELADGTLVMPFNSERHMTERTMPAIQRGLEKSGRSLDQYEVITEVIVGMGRTDEELERAMAIKSLIAFYASTPSYTPVLEVHGWDSLQPELNALSKRGRWAEMSSLISDEMMHTIGVFGTPTQCADEIVRRYGNVCDEVCTYFPGYDVDDGLLGEFVDAVHSTPRDPSAGS